MTGLSRQIGQQDPALRAVLSREKWSTSLQQNWHQWVMKTWQTVSTAHLVCLFVFLSLKYTHMQTLYTQTTLFIPLQEITGSLSLSLSQTKLQSL